MKKTSPFDYPAYASFVNVIDMLNMRGYDIGGLSWVLEMVYGTSKPYVPLEMVKIDARQLIPEISRQMKVFADRIQKEHPGKTLRQGMTRKFTPHPDRSDLKPLWVVFIEAYDDKGLIGQARVEEHIEQYISEHDKASMTAQQIVPRYMFVTKTKLSPAFGDLINAMSNVELWLEEQLLVNPYRQVLSPAVRPATPDEVARLKINPDANPYAQVKGGKIKLWFLNDIGVRWMNYPLGGVYYVKYRVPIAGAPVDYVSEFRMVVPATGKESTTDKTKKLEKTKDGL